MESGDSSAEGQKDGQNEHKPDAKVPQQSERTATADVPDDNSKTEPGFSTTDSKTNTEPHSSPDIQSEPPKPEPEILAVPPPMTAEDVQRGPMAAPDYETVMGQVATSVVYAQPQLPPLAYIDIMPKVIDPGNIRYKKPPTFQRFSDIVTGANMWLMHYPDLLCWKCETVERRVDSGTKINLETMSYHESAEGLNVHVFGLRIWFVRKMDGSLPQQLGLINVVPEGNLSDSIQQLNLGLSSSPIPGMVLNVETAMMKYTIGFGTFDPEVTCSCEMGASGKSLRKTKPIFRVFYVKGPTRKESIYLKEIQPRQIRRSGSKSVSKLETFEGVMSQAQQWLQTQSGIRVVNIETRDVQAKDANMNIEIFSEATDDFLSDSDCMYVRIIRIFFVNTPEVTTYATTTLTSRLFTPVKTGDKSFECMSQTMNRIVSWLLTAQLPIFSVETVRYPFSASALGVRPDRVDYKLLEGGGKRWVTAIRLYFPVPYQEPGVIVQQPRSSTCLLL